MSPRKSCGKFRIRRSVIGSPLRRGELHEALKLDANKVPQLGLTIESRILK